MLAAATANAEAVAAAAGGVLATMTSWLTNGKPDLSMSLNGILAGLVAITTPCNNVTIAASIVIGAIDGVLVVLAVAMFDKVKVDDPVGALSVHLVNGTWGTLAVGLFSTTTGLLYGFGGGALGVQAMGVAATALFVVPTAYTLLAGRKGHRAEPAAPVPAAPAPAHAALAGD